MSRIQPYAQVNMGVDFEFYGQVQYFGDSLSWPLASQIGQPGVQSVGFEVDPTGQYLIQQRQRFMLNAGKSAWSTGPDDTGTYLSPTSQSSGKQLITQVNGSLSTISDIVFNTSHGQDSFGALCLKIRRAEPPASPTILNASSYAMYVYLSWGNPEGTVGLRLAIEAGTAIRLEYSTDNANWYTADTASALGDSEVYLGKTGRVLSVEVLPMTDGSFWNAFPDGVSDLSDPPPDMTQVIIGGGDAVLLFMLNQAPFAPGNVALYVIGGQWTCEYGIVEFAPTAAIELPPVTGRVPFQTNPNGDIEGYEPYQSAWQVTPNVINTIQCGATLEIAAPSDNIDPVTGYATSTLILSYAKVDFPYSYVGRSYGSTTATFEAPGDITDVACLHAFSQADFMRRTSAGFTVNDSLKQLSPIQGSLVGVQAVFVTMGIQDLDTGWNNILLNLSGLVSFDDPSKAGLRWWYDKAQNRYAVAVSDRFHALKTCGRMRSFDRQCHYYAQRILLERQNITDDWMNFPYCGRDSDCPHYHLPGGTNALPLLQPDPSDTCIYWMKLIRQLAGEVDPSTNTVLPMYMFEDQSGVIQYFPAPIGLVQTWLTPSLGFAQSGYSLSRVYSTNPVQVYDDGSQALDALTALQTSSNLSNIRTSIVNEGINPFDGSINIAWYYNPALMSDPSQPGYIGQSMEFVDISRYYTTPQAAYTATAVQAVQLSFPSIQSEFTADCLQTDILPITADYGIDAELDPCIVGVQDFGTQGSTAPVSYYPVTVAHRIYQEGSVLKKSTQMSARLLGQAA